MRLFYPFVAGIESHANAVLFCVTRNAKKLLKSGKKRGCRQAAASSSQHD